MRLLPESADYCRCYRETPRRTAIRGRVASPCCGCRQPRVAQTLWFDVCEGSHAVTLSASEGSPHFLFFSGANLLDPIPGFFVLRLTDAPAGTAPAARRQPMPRPGVPRDVSQNESARIFRLLHRRIARRTTRQQRFSGGKSHGHEVAPT